MTQTHPTSVGKSVKRSEWLEELGNRVVSIMKANDAGKYFEFYSPPSFSGNEVDAFLELGALRKFPDTKIELLLASADHTATSTWYHNPTAYPDLIFSFVTKKKRTIRAIAEVSNAFFPPFQPTVRDNAPTLELGRRNGENSFGVLTSYLPVFTRWADDFLALDIAYFFYI